MLNRMNLTGIIGSSLFIVFAALSMGSLFGSAAFAIEFGDCQNLPPRCSDTCSGIPSSCDVQCSLGFGCTVGTCANYLGDERENIESNRVLCHIDRKNYIFGKVLKFYRYDTYEVENCHNDTPYNAYKKVRIRTEYCFGTNASVCETNIEDIVINELDIDGYIILPGVRDNKNHCPTPRL